MAEAVEPPSEPTTASTDPAPCAERAEADEIAEIEREARSIVSDAAVDERPELYAHRLPSFGAEIVHWRPRGEREFRYLLRESFD